MSDFVSLNAWNAPGLIYQAENAAEIVEGGPGDWGKLRAVLARYESAACDTPHPTGAAIGTIHYDGGFWFGLYPEVRVVSDQRTNEVWRRRRAAAEVTSQVCPWQANRTPAQFERMVERAKDYIQAGHIYQVNLAQRFVCDFTGNPYALFEQLMWRSPAPGGAFLEQGQRRVLCSSPELFLKIQGRHIVTRPIKGTRPRDRDALRDQQLAYELMTNPKEQAELIMITDLMRSDLGQTCEFGSVTVTDLLRLERYAQVYHLVSTVEGHLRADVDAISAVASCFPGGSITGAPKRRAMEIIAELEPESRGLYTGAIGYFAFNGDAAFSMAIRTMIQEAGQLHFHVGSGVTIDSDPAQEYRETLHKAEGMKMAVREYSGLAASVASV